MARARVLRDPLLRMHYEAAHGALRHLLSRATGVPASDLVFGNGHFGKPFLQMPNAPGFNMAHCEHQALIGITAEGARTPALEFGVDLEAWRSIPDAEAMAEHFCSDNEARTLATRHQPEQATNRSFLDLWTRKEACLKAMGTGLHLDPRSFHAGLSVHPVSLALTHPTRTATVRVESIDLAAHQLSAAFAWLLP